MARLEGPSGSQNPLITTNGMLIIDKIIDRDGKVYENIAGGGGMFAMLGGCIVSLDSKISRSLKWIVDCGYDFPAELMEEITSWGSGAVFRHDDSRETTRGWNHYSGLDLRNFKYLNQKKIIQASDWKEFGEEQLKRIECLHLVCSTERFHSLKEETSSSVCHPQVIVWEPLPDICDQAHYNEIEEIIGREEDFAIVFSPNAEEGARLLGDIEPLTLEEADSCIKRFDQLLADKNVCVLRCGKLGSLTLTSRNLATGKRSIYHHPAYHENSPDKVIDPTGGGNSFLGGFCLAYTATQDLKIANICGNIAAGCIIEQIGVPKFDHQTREWNGQTFRQRLDTYLANFPEVADKKADQVCQELTYRWS